MSKVRSMTALMIPLIAMLLVVPGWTHGVAAASRTDPREPPLAAATALVRKLYIEKILAVLARGLLASWSVIENEKVFLVAAEIAVALVLVLALSHARTSWQNRRLSRMARTAGMVYFSSGNGVLSRRGAQRRKEQHAVMR